MIQKTMGRLKFTLGFYGTILGLFLMATIIINLATTTWFILMIYSIVIMVIIIPSTAKFIETALMYRSLKMKLLNEVNSQLPEWI